MKLSAEQTPAGLVTVIRKPFDVMDVSRRITMGFSVLTQAGNGEIERPNIVNCNYDYEVFILPPLPIHPTADDAELLHLYAAHGLKLTFEYTDYWGEDDERTDTLILLQMLGEKGNIEITNVTNKHSNQYNLSTTPGEGVVAGRE